MDSVSKVYPLTPPLMRPENDGAAGGAAGASNNRGGVDGMPLAMAYVPMQRWRDIYENDKALMRGTIFSELDLPFKGAGMR